MAWRRGLSTVGAGLCSLRAASMNPLAFALDFPDVKAARPVVRAVAAEIGMLKVGLELFLAGGASAVKLGLEVDLPVFLDLKLHDIPETVDRAVARAASLGAKMLTVHASGGPAMLERAVARAAAEATGLQIVAVTVLTSLDESDLVATGVVRDPAAHALGLATMAKQAGVDAFVCSPKEARSLRDALGPDVVLITPGVRAKSADAGDQKRVASAGDAIRAGATWVVVGRPIRDAADPVLAARAIADEIREASA